MPRPRRASGRDGKQILHKCADVQSELRPQRLVVRVEHRPRVAAVEAFFEEYRRAADREILPVASRPGVAQLRSETSLIAPGIVEDFGAGASGGLVVAD
jgi:hypothetical protein